MDARKQKRLGAAPIASFEKSFEETGATGNTAHTSTTSAMTGSSSATAVTVIPAASFSGSTKFNASQEHETLAKDIHNNGEMLMEPREHINKTAADTATTLGKARNAQAEQPSIAVSLSESAVVATDAIAAAAAVSPSNRSKHEGNNTRRPPPLKSTTCASTTAGGGDTVGQPQTQHQQLAAGVGGAYKGATTLATPSTPRIELSRASSSSHHEEDSRESSPENVFEQETIGLGFREEGALELRSSTEELYFMDPEQKKEEQEKIQQQQQVKRSSPHIFKFDDHQSYLQQHQRKDSASSEVAALLCISGRTSRISSVGSQGSAVSRLSAVSGVSRSPSPHRMLLETSFCGPKPLENVVDGRVSTTIEPPTVELLEQVLLSRKHDPTQAVLAEGITVESSPKKKPISLSNGEAKPPMKSTKKAERPNAVAIAPSGVAKPVMGAQRRSSKSPGQMVIGKTPSGTEYIRINLKPDYMYNDKGIAPHEKIVEAPNSIAPLYSRSQKKPASLSLGRTAVDENRLTPTASPKPTRHGALTKDTHGSRSPSPATVSVSRKSSFSSLFRLGGKDSPDSPRERSRSRSKSKERPTPQSQNVTPSKQKSVLAIFKPGKRGSNAGADAKSSKSSSPIDGHELQQQMQQMRSKSHTPSSTTTGGGSRPASRLRYYDEPVEGVIHIPLHTPPEEKEARKLLHGIQQLNAEPMRPVPTAITASQLAAAAAALKPVGARKGSGSGSSGSGQSQPRSQQVEKLQRLENLDAIHTLSQEDDNKERTWSLEVNKYSSQDSQETAGSETSYASAIKVNIRSNLANVKENVVQENGMAAEAEIHRLPSVDSGGETKIVETVATVNVNITQVQPENEHTKEKRRLLFTTRLGSGSQDPIFSTQFSISKTESQSSQLSEQVQETIIESPGSETLHRQGTVIRRSEEEVELNASTKIQESKESVKLPPKRRSSTEISARRQKSISTSEDEKHIVQTTVTAVVMRRKESHEQPRRKSRSTSEDDADAGGGIVNQRHSRYLENFDVRKKYHENVPRKPKRQSVSEPKHGDSTEDTIVHVAEQRDDQKLSKQHQQRKPTLPQPPPPSTAPSPSPPPTAPSVSGSRSPTPTQRVPRSQSQSPVDRSGKQTPVKPPRTSTPTRRSQGSHVGTERQSMPSTDEPVESSESERDSDLAGGSSAAADPKRRHLPRHVGTIEDHESTGLVSQESFDELPYVPTTLPEERAHGVPLVPMKDRANMELKTCPVERPRSTTPLNPSHLEEYCGIVTPQEQTYELSGSVPVRGEKLRISLPRKDSTKERVQSAKSPRRPSNTSGKSWFEFAEEGLRATSSNLERKDSNKQLLQQQTQPELEIKTKVAVSIATTTTVQTTQTQITPTSGTTTTQRKLSGHWIDFENIPEKRKPPKRITALPKDGVVTSTSSSRVHATTSSVQHISQPQMHTHGHGHDHQQAQPDVTMDGKIHYNYVKPEDCQCECHEAKREGGTGAGADDNASAAIADDEVEGVTSSKSITSVDLLQQGEDMLPLLDPDTQDGIEPSDSSREYSCYTDDEMDVPMRRTSSSRSKGSSSKLDEFPRRDVSHSPRNRKFPDNRK
ncbi:serine-rich adhesin for platelets isoform X2 [Bactrocera dorsalis]|uniref:Serine-rich adhesin for platelets isoform X2 n=1 Tax=Bactrocera dorsalis TaxID=27457 RepID=A0ABM3JTK3_BACDO|nr:serine-rich adhesin for platelets isoform X2 [Bactrocera dorsalis]